MAGMDVSFICLNDCVTRLSELPDHAKVSDPAGDYILSLNQHFLIHPTVWSSKLHMKEIFAKTTIAASVTNTLFKLCGRTFFKEYMLAMDLRTTPWTKSSSDTFDVDDGGCFDCYCSSRALFFSSTIF